MSEVPAAAARAFLSYSRRDTAAADLFLAALEARGLSVFRDTEDILPAEDWRGRLDALIGTADAVVFLMSPNSVRSDVCAWEIHLAGKLGKRLVPVLLEPVSEAATPPELSRLNYVIASSDRDFDDAISKIVSAVQTDIAWVRDHTRLGERAREWDRGGERPAAGLLRGGELAGAEAWLASQPATGPAPTNLTREWIAASRTAAVRRQRNWVAGSLVVAAVSIGLGVLAEINRRSAAEQRDRAERILDRSSKTANDLVFDMAQRFRDREGVPQALVFDLLSRSKGLLDQLSEAGENRPDLLRSRSAALTEMSVTLARQGDLEAAHEVAAEANAHFAALAESGEPAALADLAVGLDREGDILMRLEKVDEAAARFHAAVEINQRIATENTPANWRLNLAVSKEKMGDVAVARDEVERAMTVYDEALAIRADVEPDGRGVAILREKRGDAFAERGDRDRARAEYQASLALTEALSQKAPSDTRLKRDLSVILQKLGDLVAEIDGPAEAMAHFEADLAIARALRRLDPEREDWTLDLIVSLDRMGVVRFLVGDAGESLALLAEADGLATTLAEQDPGRIDLAAVATRAAQKLSLIAFEVGDHAGAADAAARNADRLAAVSSDDVGGGLYADAMNNVAWYSLFTGEATGALAAAQEATSLDPGNDGYRLNLAHALMFSGEIADARRIYASREDENWRQLVEADFAAFEAAGLTHPGVDAVLRGAD